MRLDIALEVFNSMAPVFLLIFCGWLAVHFGFLEKDAKKTCSTIVTNFTFPALLFNETYRAQPSQIFDLTWIAAFTIAMCSMWLIGFALNRMMMRKSLRESSMLALLCSFPNMGGMGIPFLALLIGPASAISVAVANVIVAITVIPATLFVLELGAAAATGSTGGRGLQIFGGAILSALKKPMVFSVILGLLVSTTGTSQYLPKAMTSALDITTKASNFISLFTVGVSIYGTKVALTRSLSLNLSLKCLINPVIVWCLVLILGLTGSRAEEMIFLLVMPTATNAAILAIQWNVMEREAASLYMATTALSLMLLPLQRILMVQYLPGVT